HQEFELTDSDIKFFTSRNLNIPKRCKRCREINRKINNSNNYQYDSDDTKIADYKTIIFILSVIIIAVLIISGTIIFSLSHSDKPEYSQSDALSVTTQTTHITSSMQTKPVVSTTQTNKATSSTQTKPTTSSTEIKQTTSTTQTQQITYYLNTYRNKFHKTDCDSVSQMNARNRKAFYGTREEAIAQGYSPCHNCNP
ncbi:MAG: hypothetical protein K2K89_08290, partial [Ruminococcus sp.]|nr:hypothetical protein [Ruminococcus sp.]